MRFTRNVAILQQHNETREQRSIQPTQNVSIESATRNQSASMTAEAANNLNIMKLNF